ncbi:MAG TPA: Na+/H+ antiporter NhaA [Vicinamibacterales bacterium]|nr:Na+/H+ antiporter NhaA [Vicinamibacterales bacterium]
MTPHGRSPTVVDTPSRPGPIRATVTILVDSFFLLPIGVLIALVWANTAGLSYFRFAHALRFIVNDIGMVFFVGLVTEEALEAVMPGGALYRWRRTLLPIVAAAGSVLGATAIYVLYLRERSEFMLLEGWPVAAAQDVALAYFIAKAIFRERRGPVGFLLVMAIVSDAIAIASIVFWYPTNAQAFGVAIGLMAMAIVLAAALRAARVDKIWLYLVTSGTLSWIACYWSGIQPALALVPVVPFLPHRSRNVGLSAEAQRATPRRFEHIFKYTVQVVLLFYGLVNGGVVIGGEMPGAWAVLLAALVGRPAGVLISIGLAMAAGLRLPLRLGWRELIVMSLAASAGFTFALFFAASVIPAGPLLNELKLGALSTAMSAVLAFAAARLLHVGRFVRKAHKPNHGGRPSHGIVTGATP